MSVFFEFDEVDTFTAAALGEPGSRVFYLHARAGNQRVTVKCEKQQVTAIAQYLRRVLSDLPPPEDRPLPGALDESDADRQSFVLGPIGLGYDRGNDRLLVQLEELVAGDDEDSDEPVDVERGHVRLYVTRSQAAAFCDHADELVAAGRPSCVWCGNPIDPDGHPCPRMN
ncbi:MAG TPA: DUF3090 family protein [Ilumatobacteraceae bacterium]|nr:DUF3090 family protein [Ilumatobacteraceae bacterium]